jgi:hypothetical protein
LYVRRANNLFRIWGKDVWTSGNFNPDEYWRKDELLKFSKRWYSSARNTIHFLKIDFTDTNGAAAYYLDFFTWGGSVNNYSNLNRERGWFLIEDGRVQAEPSTLLDRIYPMYDSLSITLNYELSATQNQLIVKGEQCWGTNWLKHTVL